MLWLLIDLIYNFDVAGKIWMDLYTRDWKVTSRHPKFQYLEFHEKKNWKAQRIKLDKYIESTVFNIRRLNCMCLFWRMLNKILMQL